MTDWTTTVQRAQDKETEVTPVGKFGNDMQMVVGVPEVNAEPEENTLYPVYYAVLEADNATVVQRGVVQKVEFDQLKLDGVNIHQTDGFGNIIDA